MVRPIKTLVLVALLAASAASCGTRSPTAPTAPAGSFRGTWTGTVSEDPRGQGTIRLVLDQNDVVLTGTLRTTFQGMVDRDGPVTGVVVGAGSDASITHAPPRPVECGSGVTLTGTITITARVSAGRLAGSYFGFTCGGAVAGVFDAAPG